MFNQGKSSWNSSAVFLIAMIGAVLSLTSLTQFSYIMYGNGGGAFLIPYIIAIVLILLGGLIGFIRDCCAEHLKGKNVFVI